MPNFVYDSYRLEIMAGEIDLIADPIKALLVTGNYRPDPTAHSRRSDVKGEVEGPGYYIGGQLLSGKKIFITRNDEAVLDADNLSWEKSDFTARGAILYKVMGGKPDKDPLIAYLDFGKDRTASGGPFRIQWSVDGLLALGRS